ncbi:hypothetical protein BJ875DRAFT_82857 [Amylocarpus encephaloides]|uniref:Fibroin-3 related protein n=1 Tax=Amylocarpus encephaloides TaxID=45428 RepID=A0A9P7YFM7_9HELO|nr:hypothetical protein BJ875DRAFT_82857 [Amylocarpus encephaloides]
MPHISTAMERSVRRSLGEYFFGSLLGRRAITGEVDKVRNAFSSWDACMQAAYCKWPVIAVIIIGGLIILSVLWCCVRCLCCGMSCCCSCFSFMNCCCGGCCDGKKNAPHKHLDGNDKGGFSPPHDQGYQAPDPMMGGALPQTQGLITSRDPPPPQFAQFEIGKNGLYVEPKAVSDDALPPMPSWDAAAKKHVAEEEKDAVELKNLDPNAQSSLPLMTGAAPPANNMPPSPAHDLASPYSQPGKTIGGNGYANVPSRSPVNQQNGFNGNGNMGYRGSPSPGPGRGGPRPGYGPNSTQDMNRGYFPPQGQDQFGDDQYMGAMSNGRPPPQRQYSNNSPGPRQFPPQPTRQFSNDSSRPLNPERQYPERSQDGFQQNGPPPRGPSRGPGPGPRYEDFQANGPPPRGPARDPSRGPVSRQGYDQFQANGPPPRGPSRGPGPNRLYDNQQGPPRGPSRGPTPGQGPARIASPGPINSGGFDFGAGQQQPYSRPTPPPQDIPYGRGPTQRQDSRDPYYDGASEAGPPTYASRSPPPQEPAYPGYKPYTPPV